jgi:spore coat protein U-like protein
MNSENFFKYLTGLGPILMPALVFAGSATSAFRVTATVDPTCTIQTTPATFGHYNPITTHATAPLEITSSVTITCSRGMATTIGLDRGLHADYAQDTTRAMKHVVRDEYLRYELYQDPIRTTLWGTSGAHLVVPPVAEDTKPRTYLIFGRVPAGQDVSLGDYHDTIVAVVNF